MPQEPHGRSRCLWSATGHGRSERWLFLRGAVLPGIIASIRSRATHLSLQGRQKLRRCASSSRLISPEQTGAACRGTMSVSGGSGKYDGSGGRQPLTHRRHGRLIFPRCTARSLARRYVRVCSRTSFTYSTISSAKTESCGEIASPRASATLRLITRLKCVGLCTGN
jgi:hypothetical protein